MEEMLYDLIMK